MRAKARYVVELKIPECLAVLDGRVAQRIMGEVVGEVQQSIVSLVADLAGKKAEQHLTGHTQSHPQWCLQCSKIVPRQARFCPFCGTQLDLS